MAANIDIKIDMNNSKLKEMLEKVKENIGIKVGILGADGTKPVRSKNKKEHSDGREKKEELNEATLGAIHEYGSEKRNIPSRSFIRMPIEKKFKTTIVKNSKFKDAVQRLNIKEINGSMGETAVSIILDAFETGGFGNWAPLSEETKRRKTGEQSKILVDTGDLEHSITYEELNAE